MRQPQAGCNAPSAIVTAAAQFIDIADVTPRTCSTKPIDYSYSLGYHVRELCLPLISPFATPLMHGQQAHWCQDFKVEIPCSAHLSTPCINDAMPPAAYMMHGRSVMVLWSQGSEPA